MQRQLGSRGEFARAYVVAHEVGHLLLHADTGEHSAAIEKEADEFAAAFLTPAASMDAALPQRLDLAALDRLGRTWGVSPTSLIRRMVERGRTTESSARRAYQRLSAVYDSKADPTSAYPGEVPTLLRKAADLAGDHGGSPGDGLLEEVDRGEHRVGDAELEGRRPVEHPVHVERVLDDDLERRLRADEARQRGTKAASAYLKAHQSLAACQDTLVHPSETVRVRGIGASIAERIERAYAQWCAQHGQDMPPKPGSMIAPSRSHTTARPRKTKTYIPEPRSGAHGLLVALYTRVLEDDDDEAQLGKSELIARAQPYCDSDYTMPGRSGAAPSGVSAASASVSSRIR